MLMMMLLRKLSEGSWSGDEMAWHDMVLSNVLAWDHGSISPVGLTVHIDNIVVHVFLLVDVSIISRVAVCQLIRVLSDSRMSLEVAVDVDNRIVVVSLVLELSIIHGVSISKLLAELRLNLISVLVNSGGVLRIIFLIHPNLGSSLQPLTFESIVVNDVVLGIILILNFLIVSYVAIGEIVRFLSKLNFSAKLDPLMVETIVIDDVIFGIIFVFDFLVVGLVAVSQLI